MSDESESLDEYEIEVEWTTWSLQARATRKFGNKEYQCRIKMDAYSDGQPSVTFRRRTPDSDVDVLSSWSSYATGRLSGPQKLRAWMYTCHVFQAALAALTEEMCGSVSSGQQEVYERVHEEPHPVFGVEHRPEREPVMSKGDDDD